MAQIAFQLKFWKTTNQNFPNLLLTWPILLLQQIYFPVPLKWHILYLFIRTVTSLTATIINSYLFFLTLVKFLRKLGILRFNFWEMMQNSWIKIKFFQVFSLAFEINIPHTIPLLVSPKWFDQHLTIISSRVMYLSVYRKHLIL